MRLRAGGSRPVRGVVLAVVVLVVLTTLGLGVWLSFHGAGAPSGSIFDQAPSGGVSPGTSQPLTARNLAHLQPLWAHTFAPDAPSRMAVANGMVYLTVTGAARNFVAAIQNGRQVWRAQTADPPQYIRAIQVDGAAVVLVTDTAIYALNANTGQALWQYRAAEPIHLGVADGDLVYAAGLLYFSTDEQIYALETSTGQLAWQYRAAARIHLGIADGDLVYADGLLYYSTDEQVYALEVSTGQLAWSYRFSADSQSAYSPIAPVLVVGAGRVYLSLSTSPYVVEAAVTALDGRTGMVRWQVREEGASTITQPVLIVGDNGLLYRRVRDGVTALDATTGHVSWHIAVSAAGSYDSASMAADQQRLYLNVGGHIEAFDVSTGHLVWSSAALDGSRVMLGPMVSNGAIYVATATPVAPYGHALFTPIRAPHWMYAFDASSGSIVRMPQENDATYEPEFLAVDETHLYVLGSRSFIGADESAKGEPELYALGV
ncbi:MAG TPA: PQQ-binding-like beta-propeller repeat protein [Ktedonobacterales bacterium]|jgi:outer membrane protein assembly factor BamB|nr:PQQ-binding-like beta-propeller repeat protein [Ktedonobacterales bacterium]